MILIVTTLRVLFLSAAMVRACSPANLAVSTYFKDGFTPAAIASDAQGDLLIAGSAVIDPASGATGVAVAKLDTKASQYLYLAYPDSAATRCRRLRWTGRVTRPSQVGLPTRTLRWWAGESVGRPRRVARTSERATTARRWDR